MDIVISDLSKYGYRELDIAGDLLKAYAEYGADFMSDGITLNFNINSGLVFLSDEDMNVGVLENGKFVQFFSCPECGFEGTATEAGEEGKDFKKYQGSCSQKCFKQGTE